MEMDCNEQALAAASSNLYDEAACQGDVIVTFQPCLKDTSANFLHYAESSTKTNELSQEYLSIDAEQHI